MPKSFDWGRGEDSFNYGRDEQKSFDYGRSEAQEQLSLMETIAKCFIKVNEKVINHHNNLIDSTKKAMSGLEASHWQRQNFQIRIDDLLTKNEKLIAECEELKNNPSEETINKMKAKHGIA